MWDSKHAGRQCAADQGLSWTFRMRESHGVVHVLCGHVLSAHLGEATRAHGHAELSCAGLLRRIGKLKQSAGTGLSWTSP